MPQQPGTTASFTLPSAAALERLRTALNAKPGDGAASLADALKAAGVQPQLVSATLAGQQVPLQQQPAVPPAAPQPLTSTPPAPARSDPPETPHAAGAAQANQQQATAPSTGTIVGAVVGAVGGVLLLAALCFILVRRGMLHLPCAARRKPAVVAGDPKLLQQHPGPASNSSSAGAAPAQPRQPPPPAAAARSDTAASALPAHSALSKEAAVARWLQQLSTRDGVADVPAAQGSAPLGPPALTDMPAVSTAPAPHARHRAPRSPNPRQARAAAADTATTGVTQQPAWRRWLLRGRGGGGAAYSLPVYADVGLLRATYAPGLGAQAAAGSNPSGSHVVLPLSACNAMAGSTAGTSLAAVPGSQTPSVAAAPLDAVGPSGGGNTSVSAEAPLGLLRETYAVLPTAAAVQYSRGGGADDGGVASHALADVRTSFSRAPDSSSSQEEGTQEQEVAGVLAAHPPLGALRSSFLPICPSATQAGGGGGDEHDRGETSDQRPARSPFASPASESFSPAHPVLQAASAPPPMQSPPSQHALQPLLAASVPRSYVLCDSTLMQPGGGGSDRVHTMPAAGVVPQQSAASSLTTVGTADAAVLCLGYHQLLD